MFLLSFHGMGKWWESAQRGRALFSVGCGDETIWCPLVHIGQRVSRPRPTLALRMGAGCRGAGATPSPALDLVFNIRIFLVVQ